MARPFPVTMVRDLIRSGATGSEALDLPGISAGLISWLIHQARRHDLLKTVHDSEQRDQVKSGAWAHHVYRSNVGDLRCEPCARRIVSTAGKRRGRRKKSENDKVTVKRSIGLCFCPWGLFKLACCGESTVRVDLNSCWLHPQQHTHRLTQTHTLTQGPSPALSLRAELGNYPC